MGTTRRHSKWKWAGTALASLLFGASALCAQNSLPQLWPTFSEPSTIVNVGLAGQSGDDFMATTSFEGAYNQQQLSTRLYVNTPGDANYWLTHAVPAGITVTNLSYNSGDPDGTIKALLSTYGPQGTNTVTKYVVCDPVNIPESCNMATTLAGIDDAMVVNPDNLSVISSYGLTEAADLRTYIWIGTSSALVNSTTYNMVSNPSGGNGTTGWSGSGTLSTATYDSQSAIEWSLPANQSGDAWVKFDPAIPSARINTTPYIFSFQVAGSGTVFMDVWNGCGDVQSSTVSLTSSYQTIQMGVPLPLSGCTGNSTVEIQLRAHSQSNAVTAYFNSAAVIDNRTAIDMYQYNNLLSQTSKNILAQDFYTNGNLRDYLIAAKIFTFELTQDDADEEPLYQSILTNSHTAHVTPIMGYIDDEGNDVKFLSEAAENGHFLNASDDYNNASVWASMPQPSSLSQTRQSPLKTYAGSIYLAFAASDGDNSSIVEHQDVSRWTNGKFFGAVPMAWTMPPGMINFAPGILSNYYAFLPPSQELITGPSGVGYTTGITGSDLTTFASYTDEFMQAEAMNTATVWSAASSDLDTLAADLNGGSYNVPHVVTNSYLAYTQEGSATPYTVLDGQGVGYNAQPLDEVSAIESWVSSNYSSTAPNFLEVLDDNLTTPADDVLYIAQQVQRDSSHPYVFMTPSELAAAEYAYHNSGSTVTSTPQAVLGATLNSAFPQNMLFNSDGQDGAYNTASTSWALSTSGHGESLVNTIYEGASCEELKVGGADAVVAAYEALGKVPYTDRIYRFSVNVAGTGTAYMTVYDGTTNHQSASVTLTSSFQTITMLVSMNSTTAGQIQVDLAASTSAQTLYFSGGTSQQVGWSYGATSSSNTTNIGSGSYNNGSFAAQTLYLGVPASEENWAVFYVPNLTSGATYTVSVDVAGTGQAYLAWYNGSSGYNSSTVTLGSQWQTLSVTEPVSGSGTPRVQVVIPSGSSAQTVYFRNASVIESGSGGTVDFYTGLESGQTQLTWTNTVDSTSPGGGESDVSGALTEAGSAITHGGADAIEYGGTASGGSSTHAYLEAFSNSTTLSSTSRLSYWVYPMTPMGSESGASTMTGLNSTCVAIDIIFTDGTALRNLGIKDQYSDTLAPASQCNHLQPDQWNYVTANLSSISGKTISRIDIGYDQPGASGNYGGYIDDITLSH